MGMRKAGEPAPTVVYVGGGVGGGRPTYPLWLGSEGG